MNISAFKNLINSKNTYIIHYASNGICKPSSPIPNISCIVIYGTNNEIRRRFFIQDFLKDNSLEQAEKIILQRFADFISENPQAKFIHWGMNGDSFGFKTINKRCNELEIKIKEISHENRIDLFEIVFDMTGKKFSIKQTLMMNGYLSEDFLTGAEECEAYNNRKYGKIFNSVKDKVIGFSCIIDRIIDNTLKTNFSKY